MQKTAGILVSFILFLCIQKNVFARTEKYDLSVQVADYTTGQGIAYATYYDSLNQIQGTADSLGKFKLTIPKGSYTFEISSVGYQSLKRKINLTENTTISIGLIADLTLGEITIAGQKTQNTVETNASGLTTLSTLSVQKLPSFFGEKDIMRAVLLTPGIQSGQEGARGIFVRGGSPDQNLMIYHKAPIFNASHIYGFLSVFPLEAISKMDIYKSFIPSRFTGRLSSVLDIQPNYGNTNAWKGDYSISFITQKFHIEGPLKKDKTSFNLVLRDCHAGAFVYPVSKTQYKKASGNDGSISYFFYDINAGIQHKINEHHTLNWSMYSGSDYYHFEEIKNDINVPKDREVYKKLLKKLKWMNTNTTLEWNYQKQKLEADLSYHLSVYQLNPVQQSKNQTTRISTGNVSTSNADYKTLSRIIENGLHTTVKQQISKMHQIDYGMDMAYRFFIINKVNRINKDKNNNVISNVEYKNDNVHVLDGFFFADYTLNLKDLVILKTGLQFYQYYDFQKFRFYPLPRIEAIIHPRKEIDLRLSFMQTVQPLHLLTNNTGDIQNDVWVPATKKIAPETAWQVSGGIQYNAEKGYTASIDAYYKQMKHLTEYRYGTFFMLDQLKWEDQLLSTGIGKAYGIEFFAAKTRGQFTAWMKYSLGWSKRQFPELNQGDWYYYKYDRRHDFSIVLQYKMKKHFDFTVSWTYGTGWRLTSPQSQYTTDYSIALIDLNNAQLTGSQGMALYWDKKNDYIMPAYHHLDISMNYTKKAKRCTHQFNVSVYNVYNNFNVFTIYRDAATDANGNEYTKYVQLSMFPVLPSLGYTVNFDIKTKKHKNEMP